MSSDTLSLIVWCRPDAQSDAIQLRTIRVDTGETVRIRENTLLLRISTDASTAIERCAIRHIASGREAYVQGGAHLRAFINDCILQQQEPPLDNAPDTSAT
jgi:hypothetical protein